jgi:hypothetical protein
VALNAANRPEIFFLFASVRKAMRTFLFKKPSPHLRSSIMKNLPASPIVDGWHSPRVQGAHRVGTHVLDGSEIMQVRISRSMFFSAIALFPPTAHVTAAEERIYLGKAEIESVLIDKGIESRNLSTGMVSHWIFRPDGRVEFANKSGPGSTSGTWVVQTDGLMCVTMLARTGCRYWFRQGGTFANAPGKEPGSPLVAEIAFE